MKLFKSWKSCFYALLLHPTEAKVLIQSSNDNYCLPCAEINKGIWLSNFKAIKDAIEQELSIAVNVLHYATYQVDKGQRRIKAIYVVEQHNYTEKIQVGTWCDHAVPAYADRTTLESLSFTHPEQKSIIEAYLIELESANTPKLRPPWAQPRWFNDASVWIEEQLQKLNYQQVAPVEYVKSWSISCVLKVKTTAGTIYFKEASTLPLFCDEPIVTAELASFFPQHIPTVLSIDRQRHWMLLEDFGEPIGSNISLKVQQDIYRLLAQIQIKSIEHRDQAKPGSKADRLLAVGCLDRRLDILQSQIDPLINDENALSELSMAEIDRLHNLAPDLKNLCSQLASYKIPETLVHGDLHLSNVALHKDNYLFFDWTDSCIAHPFFDLFELFFERDQAKPGSEADRQSFLGRLKGLWQQKSKQRLRDRYLSQWTQYEPRERLLDAWNIAKPLCALHHAVSYQHIFRSLEPRTKQELNSLPYFLRKILRHYSIVNN